MKMKLIIILTTTLLFCANANAQEYTFGIVPQQSAKKLARKWGPILQQLSEKTGFNLKFATAKDIPTFEKRLAAGEYDLAYMNPYHFTVFNKAPGYTALAHQANKSIQGIVVVRKDSPVTTLDELNDNTLAFPSPAAFAATLLPQAEMKNGGVEYTPRYVSSHDSVYLNVANGLLPAGGGVVRTFKNTDPEVREQLRILWKTKGYTPHAFAAHPAISQEDKLSIQNALVSLAESPAGMVLLENISFEGIVAAEDENWDDVRALNLTALND